MIEGLNVLDLVIILGAMQGVVFSVHLWFHPLKNRKATWFLSVFILAFAANSIYYTLETIGVWGSLNGWDFSLFYCSLLIIGAFYFFITIFPQSKSDFFYRHFKGKIVFSATEEGSGKSEFTYKNETKTYS